MKKFHLVLTFLLAIGALFLLSPISLAVVHHSHRQQQSRQKASLSRTTYYSFSSLVTAGSGAGTIGAVNEEGGLTLHIDTDGTFTGTIVANSASIYSVRGSFHSDGSIHMHIFFPLNRGTAWDGRAYPQRHNIYRGTFAITKLGMTLRSGIWALVPVKKPQNVVAIDVSAFTATGPDRRVLYGGVLILVHHGSHGTFRLQDGRVVPVFARISQHKISFIFTLNKHLFVFAIGTSTTIGSVVKYTGTFVGPRRGDRGNWSGYLFTFAS